MSTDYLNPMASTYDSILKLIKSLTIKYNVKAEENETSEATLSANEYLDAIEGRTTFDSYVDYTYDDMVSVGITDYNIINTALTGDTSVIPDRFRQPLYELRVKKIIDNYVELNNYYRTLNGLPNLDENPRNYFYITDAMAANFGIDQSIPVHQIQDYYNKINPGDGDYYMSLVEGSGYIDKLIEANPDKEYLNYVGQYRISIQNARTSKNFQILLVKETNVKNVLHSEFTSIYEQCREYFVNVVYNRNFRSFIEYYDNFIALCIMVMTIQQLVIKQIPLGIRREFFDIYALKMLYEVYGIPYNLDLDEDTQQQIVRNLNLFIQDKATNKVIYNIAEALGFGSNFSIYKFYLSKQHKVDAFGVPIFKETQRFNDSIGEVETVPDYEAMYDVYFHKAELKDNNFVNTFNDALNTTTYEEITKNDPYWWLDSNTFEKVWETEYNFVESKYFGISISYRLTNMIFENIVLMKMLISKEEELRQLRITLPKMTSSVEIPVFDIIILLVCLTAAKHNLTGEIVSLPTDVLNVIDFMAETGEYEDKDINEYLADAFSFNFSYFRSDEWNEQKKFFKKNLSTEDYEKMLYYASILSIPEDSITEEKLDALNGMYENIKDFYKFIELKMTENSDIHMYRQLRKLYRIGFYSKEMKNLFDITGELSGFKRTAYDFFEYLHMKNPSLYESVFEVDYRKQYNSFISKHEDLKLLGYTYDQYRIDAEIGKVSEEFTSEHIPVIIRYDTIKGTDVDDGESVKDEKIYFYVSHCISRLENVIYSINYTYVMNDMTTPIEALLIKLIRFFKSYTTELISMDSVFLIDLKPDNIIKLYDEAFTIRKKLLIPEELHISYSDIVQIASTQVLNGGRVGFIDRYIYEIWLILDNRYGVDNNLRLRDDLHKLEKLININNNFSLNDIIYQESNITFKERPNYRDKIIKMWYSD